MTDDREAVVVLVNSNDELASALHRRVPVIVVRGVVSVGADDPDGDARPRAADAQDRPSHAGSTMLRAEEFSWLVRPT